MARPGPMFPMEAATEEMAVIRSRPIAAINRVAAMKRPRYKTKKPQTLLRVLEETGLPPIFTVVTAWG